MFYIVEEETKLNHLTNLAKHSAFVEVITTNSQMHSSFTDVVAVYIRPEVGSCGYIIPVDHDEGINVTKDRIYTLLNSITTLYTLDKKSLLYHFNIQGAIDVSLLYSMTKYERLEVSSDNPTVNWYNNKYKDFKDVKLYPVRGRLSSSMYILFGSIWKKSFEKIYLNQLIDRLCSNKKNYSQCSGFNFIAYK